MIDINCLNKPFNESIFFFLGEYLNSEINENAIAFREVGILKGNFSINISLPESN